MKKTTINTFTLILIILLLLQTVGFANYDMENSPNNIELVSIQINEDISYKQEPMPITVTGKYSNGDVMFIEDVILSTSNQSIAYINNKNELEFTGVNGEVEITAQYGNFYDKKIVNVNILNVNYIYLEGTLNYSITPIQLKSYGYFPTGETKMIDNKLLVWSTSDGNVAEVDEDGLVSFTGNEGSVTITVEYLDKKDSLTTTVFFEKEEIVEEQKDHKQYDFPIIEEIVMNPKEPKPNEKVTFEIITNTGKDDIEYIDWTGVKTNYEEGSYTVYVKFKDIHKQWSKIKSIDFIVMDEEKRQILQELDTKETINPFKENILNRDNLEQKARELLFKYGSYSKLPMYNDTTNHWAKKDLQLARGLGIIDYAFANKFRPNEFITREDFVGFIGKAFDIQVPYYENTFSDLEGSPYQDYIMALNQLKVINGYEDGTFRPKNPITRAELVSILSRLIEFENVPIENNNIDFSDVSEKHWGRNSINEIASIGLVKGMNDKTFSPDRNTTRSEAITIIVRMTRLDSNVDTIISLLN